MNVVSAPWRALVFQPGGTLRPGSLYLDRAADRLLPEALLRGELVHVLSCRQIGKSSLRVRTRDLLTAQGVHCAAVDLTLIGDRHSQAEAWYFGLTSRIARQLRLPDPIDFWSAQAALPALGRLVRYLTDEALARLSGPVVIFLDELDALLSRDALDRDAFLAAIRGLYNARSDEPELGRLRFALLGVALPGDLIGDANRTPFNVGTSISLSDFDREECAALTGGLAEVALDPDALLDEIYDQVRGHPYMTQRLCQHLLQRARAGQPCAVEAAVSELFLHRGRVLESNLAYAEKWFDRAATDRRAAAMLRLYGRIREGERVPADGQDEVQLALRLTGMAAERSEDGGVFLRVRNPVFAAVFDLDWVRQREKDRMLSEPLRLWRGAGRSPDFLLRGHALRDAQLWARDRTDLLPDESRFLLEGVEAEQAAERAQIERRQAEARARAARRSAAFLGAFALLLLVSLGGALALYLRARAAHAAAEQARREEQGGRAVLLAREPQKEVQALQAALGAAGPSLFGQAPPSTLSMSGLPAAVRGAELIPVLRGHREQVRSVAFLPGGERLISLGADHSLRLWNARWQRPASQIVRHEGARFAYDGNSLAEDVPLMLLRNGTLELWAPDPLRRTHVITLPPGSTGWPAVSWDRRRYAVAVKGALLVRRLPENLDVVRISVAKPGAPYFSLDRRYLVSLDPDFVVRLWEPETGRLRAELRGHTRPVIWTRFTSDGKLLITGGADPTARVWDLERAALRTELLGHEGLVQGPRMDPPGAYSIVTASEDGTVRRWGLDAREPIQILRAHPPGATTAALSRDEQRLVTSGYDNTAKIWSLRDAREPLRVLRGHDGGVFDAYWMRRDRAVVTSSDDHTVRVWDSESGVLLHLLKGHQNGVFGTIPRPDGRHILSIGSDNTLRSWDIGEPPELRRFSASEENLQGMALSPDGRLLGAGTSGGPAWIWTIDGHAAPVRLDGGQGPVLHIAFAPDGRSVLTARSDGSVWIHDAHAGAVQQTLRQPGCIQVPYAEFSPDGRSILSMCSNQQAVLWDRGTGQILRKLEGHAWRQPFMTFPFATFAPRGDWMATAGRDGLVQIYDARQDRRLGTLQGHEGAVLHAMFSQDGREIVTAGYDHTARVWDLGTYKERLRLKGHAGAVNYALFSPKGDLLLTTSADGTARLWDAVTGQERFSVEGLFDERGAAAFSSDGETVAIVSRDRSVTLYPTALRELSRLGCAFLRQEGALEPVRAYCAP